MASSSTAILVYWRLHRPGGEVFACTSYRTSRGIELCAGPEGYDPVVSVVVRSHEDAQQLAATWKAAWPLGEGGDGADSPLLVSQTAATRTRTP